MTEEEQEALSIRYVDAARVIRLSSGRWAVFTMRSEGIYKIVPDEGLVVAATEACVINDRGYRESKELEARPRSAKKKISLNLEDLGL